MIQRTALYLLLLSCLTHSLGISQEIPNEFFRFKAKKLLYDGGENWETHTLLGSPRFQDLSNTGAEAEHDLDSLNIQARAGVHTLNKNGEADWAVAVYGFGHFTYQKYFYGYLYPRIVNDIDAFVRYSGIPRDIPRAGFSSGETDLSGIGFQNGWVTLQIGRGRESWGAGNDIQLVLSEDSPAYDYAMLGSDYGNLRVKYIHGFLENTTTSINRYITARGIEWTNRSSFIVGLSETIIYSGQDRPLDVGYMNPISSHLEVELNKRLNVTGHSNANAVWQLSVDWLIKEGFRISGNYLYDEFVIDQSERDWGKKSGKAYSFKVNFSPLRFHKSLLTVYSSIINIGTTTFRHGGLGSNNFVQRNKPLGWQYGSDGQEINMGINYFNKTNLIANLEIGHRELGEESIISRPYDLIANEIIGSFPSGIIDESLFITSELQWWWKKNISLMGSFKWNKPVSGDSRISAIIGLDIYLPVRFTI